MKRREIFQMFGIHTRLLNTIRKSGGYDRNKAAVCLLNEYPGIKHYDIAFQMAKNESIRDDIKQKGLDKVINTAIKEIKTIDNQIFALDCILDGGFGRRTRGYRI